MKLSNALFAVLLGSLLPLATAQTAPDMATGLSPYATYIPGEIDNVSPVNGNVFLKIPLLGYPQKGNRLRLNFYIYYNDKQWQANLVPNSTYTSYTGSWTPAGISPASPYSTMMNYGQAGVYVSTDQLLTWGTHSNQPIVTNVGGLGGNQILESVTYMTKYVITPDGSIHYTGDGVSETVSCGALVSGSACPEVPGWGNGLIMNNYPATDATGYDGNQHDPEGISYSSGAVADPDGNSVAWTSSGVTDTYGRSVPIVRSGAGTVQYPNVNSSFYTTATFALPVGSAMSSVPSDCPNGTTAARSWTVPGSSDNGGSSTYYLCYTSLSFQSAFNLAANLVAPSGVTYSATENSSSTGIGQALLLTAVVLPDKLRYTFTYDQYLSLTHIGLPSGGSVSYTWQNVVFRPTPSSQGAWSGVPTPISRALATRTITPGNGQPAIQTTYQWNITKSATCGASNCNQGVSFPAYHVITDSAGNDTEYRLGGTDDYGNVWHDYVVTGVTSYSGCSPHNPSSACASNPGTRIKQVTYGLTAVTSGGAAQNSPAYVPVAGSLPPTKATKTTTHLATSGGDKLSAVVSTLAPRYGTCTIYSYPMFSDPSVQPFPSNTVSGCYSTGQIASTATYDFGTAGSGSVGPLIKTESIAYAWQNSSSVLSANMLNLVANDTITDGSGSWASETDRCYNSTGDMTSVIKYPTQPSSSSCTSPASSALITSMGYSSGVVSSTVDPKGNTTTVSAFACNGALPQLVTAPDGTQTKYGYDCNTGKLTSIQNQNDINNKTSTTYTYADSLNRVTAATYPDGGDITVDYHGDALPLTMTITKATGEAAGANITTKTYDGLVRLTTTAVSDALPNIPDTIYTRTDYDSRGNIADTSAPYRSSSDATYSALTTYSYDALGRKSSVTNADGTSQSYSYDGNVMTLTDESGNQWQKTTDALGRLISVLEPSSTSKSASLPTSYTYDALGNLLTISQVGIKGSESARNRSFSYDGLSRLLAANNPEKKNGSGSAALSCAGASTGSWTNCYTYDSNSNLASEEDNRGISTQYSYDSMNRIYGKSYGTGSPVVSNGEPSACYQYSTPISSASDPNPVGALTLEWTQTGTCPGPTNKQTSIPTSAITSRAILVHDAMGRVKQEQVCPLGTCSKQYVFSYSYDLAGNLTSSNNGMPSTGSSTTSPAITWQEAYDAANHLSLVSVASQPWSDSGHPAVLFQANDNTYSTLGSMPYDVFGHLVNAQYSLASSSTPTESAIGMQRSYNVMGRVLAETVARNAASQQSTGSAGTISLSGSEQSKTIQSSAATAGTATILYTVGAITTSSHTCITVKTSTVCYTGASYASPNTIGAGIASAINSSSAPVTASGGGGGSTIYVYLTAKTTGASTNYSLSVTTDGIVLKSASYPSTLSGGKDAVTGGTFYDTGTIKAVINGVSASANWQQGSTTSTLATSLATAINSAVGSIVTATANGSAVNLVSKGTGAATNYTVVMSSTDTQTSYFSSPSFTGSGSNMSGGSDAAYSNTTVYSYQVPASGGYTPNGNIAAINDSINGNWTYTYDPLNRLQMASASTGAFANQNGCWSYDSFGNRTAESFSTSSCPSSETSVTATASYNSSNQIAGTTGNSASYQYDDAGNVKQDPLNAYLYDGEGRLCAVRNSNQSVYQYVYDAEGRRTAKATLTAWPTSCLDPSSMQGFSAQALYLRDSAGTQTTELSGSEAWVHTNFFGGAAPMVTYSSSSSSVAFHVTDHLGSRRALLDPQGNVLQTCQNLPYGNGESCPPTPTEHLFTGKERDAESGNDYFEARYYSSTAGRFMSPDWSAKVAPVPYATMDNPQTLNLYAYVRNNPITNMDPDGHSDNAQFGLMFMQAASGYIEAAYEQQLAADAAARQSQSQDQSEQSPSMASGPVQSPEKDDAKSETQQQNKEVSTVYNETSGLRPIPGQSTDADLHDARKSTAHTYENGGNFQSIDHLSSGELTATKTYGPAKAALADSVLAVQQARKEADPTHGATIAIQFDPQNQPKQRWTHNTEVVQVFGPFNNLAGGGRGVIKGHDVYIMIMKDPNLK